MGVSLCRHSPLHQNTQQGESRPGSQDHPRRPAHRLPGARFHPLVNVPHQREELHEIIRSHNYHCSPKHGCGEGGEASLPLQGEDGEQHAQPQQDAQGHPYWPWGVGRQLLHSYQGPDAHQQAQEQPHHEKPNAAYQHGHKATQGADAQADAHAGLNAQLRVQYSLLVTEQEDDYRTEHEPCEEEYSLKTAVTCKIEKEQEVRTEWVKKNVRKSEGGRRKIKIARQINTGNAYVGWFHSSRIAQ